jgi:DNA-binding transcriptional regulator YiaG
VPKALNDPMTGAELKAAIAALGFNQSSFGRATGIPARTVRSWVLGEYSVPKYIATLVRVMARAKIKPAQLP